MKRILAIAAAVMLAYGCHDAKPEVTYTGIEATLADPVHFGSEVEYAKQTYRFPQISGMKNIKAQDSLNRLFKLADIDALKADTNYLNVHILVPNEKTEYGRMYSHEWITVHYVDNDLISYSGMQEYAGGAHPSFVLLHGKTLAVKTLAPIDLNNLFTGDYKSFFKQQIVASEQLKKYTSNGTVTLDEFGTPCGDILDAILLQVDSITTTANMIVADSSLSILQVDFRDFGCPEYLRDVVEVKIPYAQLQPYINPKGYFKRFLK